MDDMSAEDFGRRLSRDTDQRIKSAIEVNNRQFGNIVKKVAKDIVQEEVIAKIAAQRMAIAHQIGTLVARVTEAEARATEAFSLVDKLDTDAVRDVLRQVELAELATQKMSGRISSQIDKADRAVVESQDVLEATLVALREAGDLHKRMVDAVPMARDRVSAAAIAATRREIETFGTKALAGIDVFAKDAKTALKDTVETVEAEAKARIAEAQATAQEEVRKARVATTGVMGRMERKVMAVDAVTADIVKLRDVMDPEALARIVEKIETLEKMEARTVAHGEATADDAPLVPREFKGPYTSGGGYRRGDLVVHFGSTFIAARPPGDAAPSMDPKGPWQLFAAAGMGGGFTSRKARKGGSGGGGGNVPDPVPVTDRGKVLMVDDNDQIVWGSIDLIDGGSF